VNVFFNIRVHRYTLPTRERTLTAVQFALEFQTDQM